MPKPNRIKNMFRSVIGSSSLAAPSLEAKAQMQSRQAQAQVQSQQAQAQIHSQQARVGSSSLAAPSLEAKAQMQSRQAQAQVQSQQAQAQIHSQQARAQMQSQQAKTQIHSKQAQAQIQSSQAQASSSSSDPDSFQSVQPTHPVIPSFSSDEDDEDMTSQHVRPKRKVTSKIPRGWVVQIIDENQVVKEVKMKVMDVYNLDDGVRVIVECDEHGRPDDKAGGIFAGVLGQLATNSLHFPIGFEKWSDMPDSFLDRVINDIIMPRFFFTVDQQAVKYYVNHSLSKKWRDYRKKLWDAISDPLFSKEDYIMKAPEGIPRDQWALFVNYRMKESTVRLCNRNRQNRQQQDVPHTCGAMSTARRRAAMKKAGEATDRGKMWIETHKRKDGTYVNDKAKDIAEKIEEHRSQRPDLQEISANDALGQVLGPEHPGRVRGLGLGVVPTVAFKQTTIRIGRVCVGSSSCPPPDWKQEMTTMKSQLHALYNFIQMNAGGRMPEELAGLFPTPPQAPDLGSGAPSPINPRRSLDGSNNENQASDPL